MFFGVTEVEYLTFCLGHKHRPHQPVDKIIYIADATGLPTVAMHRHRLLGESLHNEVGNHAPVIELAIWTVGIEDPDNPGIEIILAVKLCGNSFSQPLTLVITGTWSGRIDIAPVLFCLWVDQRVAVRLRGRSQQERNAVSLALTQQ